MKKIIIYTLVLFVTHHTNPIIHPFMQWWKWNRQNQQELWAALTVNESGVTAVPENAATTFADIGGTIPAELQELAEYIKESDLYKNIGAQMPKGILLYGPAGTGKTSLARAVAGEVNAAFFNASASEFIEMYVGVGPARIRELFTKARQAVESGNYSNAIIFIDEIDAIGTNRSHEANSEYRNTLNELLNQLDGFVQNEHVYVIAATNLLNNLDPALIRPGRFDRLIKIDLPQEADRLSIMQLYLSKIQHTVSLEYLHELARLTQNFSPAELKNMINEAAILAVRQKVDMVTKAQLQQAYRAACARKNAH